MSARICWRAGLAPEIAVAPFNQLFQTCHDPQTAFGETCDAIVLLWRLEDLMEEEIAAGIEGDKNALARAGEKIAALAAAIGALRGGFPGTIVVGVPPLPTGIPTGLLSLDNAEGLGGFHRATVAKFIELVRPLELIRLVDLDAVQRQVGFAASFDARQWYLYRQPFSDAWLFEAGVLLGRILVASRIAAKKCIVLDCDNTLWGGIVGEDGLDGIAIGEEFPGSAFRDFQKLLLKWRGQGVLLAIASKNNEADVWEVFERHDGMVLRKEHISAWQIGWGPKAESIPLIAQSLNIGTDSLVFIDDSAMEIAYMRGARPEVVCIQVPAEPEEIVTGLQNLPWFDRLDISEEDRNRANMMRVEQAREALGNQLGHEDFLRALALRLDFFRAGPEDLGRIAQLINKTNQFNLTTIRRSLDELRTLANSPDHRVFGLRVADKFGEYGLTGALIVEIAPDRGIWTVDTLLLSCRVLGRGVETGLLAALADDARAAGAAEIVASFIPTAKNKLAASFLPDHGFEPIDAEHWRLSLSDAPAVPVHIERLAAAPVPAG